MRTYHLREGQIVRVVDGPFTGFCGEVKEVEGEGVVGKQPDIPPGEWHEYNSFCVLESFEGSMEGTYLMQRPDGELFYVVIPRFPLRALSN